MTNQQTVYVAQGWFNDKQEKMLDDNLKALAENPSVNFNGSFVPLQHQYGNINVAIHPEEMNNELWQVNTFNSDISGIEGTDITMCTYDLDSPDEGTSFEQGYSLAMHKPVVVVLSPEDFDKGANLMIAKGATDVISSEDVVTYDFNNVWYKSFTGKVF